MGVSNLFNFDGYLKYISSCLNIWSQPCTLYVPKQNVTLGYENLSTLDIETGVRQVANNFTAHSLKAFIDFKPTKNVFYKFNYFPENSDELVLAYMSINSIARENCFLRTANQQACSVWGDMLFNIAKVQDLGMYKTLNRIYFLRPVNGSDLQEVLYDIPIS